MNTEFKGTKGEWEYEVIESGAGLFHCIVQKRDERIVTYVMNDYPEFIENAKIITDAGNTIQSCGLLPSQLLKQNNEMRAFLNKINYDYEALSDLKSHGYGEELEKLSLSGIENNNGWIKIESESDLPKEEINCWWMDKNKGEILGRFIPEKQSGNITYILENATHYKIVEKPKPPLF